MKELIEKLRAFRFKPDDKIIGPLYAAGYYDGCDSAATLLQSYINGLWTEITSDDKSKPPTNERVLVREGELSTIRTFQEDWCIYQSDYSGLWLGSLWRSLIPGIDTPMESEDDRI